MKVHLRKRQLKGKGSTKNRYTMYLDIYYAKRKRKREFFGMYLEPNDTKTTRDEKLKIAQNYKAKRMIELANEELGLPSMEKSKKDFIEYFEVQLHKRQGNSQITWNSTYKYLKEYSKYPVAFSRIDKQWLEGFISFLRDRVSLSSASTYFSKVKCALNEGIKDKIIIQSPATFVNSIKVPDANREYLNIAELQRIANTEFLYLDYKKAFIFSCYTGLRFGDIKSLKWSQIKDANYDGNEEKFTIHLRQAKTGHITIIPLNEIALQILGDRPKEDSLVFQMQYSGIHNRRILKKLLEAAKIDKRITFHCARHTYAVLLLAKGANLMTVKDLLGHRDIKSTQIYAKVIDESKYTAINSLPHINLNLKTVFKSTPTHSC